MREIKFRAWNSKKNFLSYGTTAGNPGRVEEMVGFVLGDMAEDLIISSMSYIDEETIIMQYTGLKDKNGKEIYEGDIVQTDTGHGLFIQEMCGVRWIKESPLSAEKLYGAVVGNIYENPELLEEK